MALEPFGETMPLLKIARHYGVDYAIPLALADYYQHGRRLTSWITWMINAMPVEDYGKLAQDVRYISRYVCDQRGEQMYYPTERFT